MVFAYTCLHSAYTVTQRIQNMKITNTSVSRISPPENGYSLHWDDDLSGFGVRVTAAGARSYIAEARVNGKTRRVTIGKHGVFTADQARKIAKGKIGDMAKGIDITAEKRRQKAESTTLEAVTEGYLGKRQTRQGKALKERTKADIRYHLKSSFGDWRKKPVAKITGDMVEARYSKLCKKSIAQANQAMRNLRAIIAYEAGTRGPDGAPIITYNPVQVLSDKKLWRGVEPRKTKVEKEEVGKWWSAVQAMRADPALTTSSKSAIDLIALLALTGMRLGEARAIRWEQVNLTDKSVTLTDTKNRTDVILPLSDVAAEILEPRPNKSEFVFPARSGQGHLKDARGQLEILSEQTGVTVTHHDLRRTFVQVGLKMLPKKERIEIWRIKLLSNHKIPKGDVTLASYADDPDRTFLKDEADRIAQFYEDQRRIHEAGNVTHLTRGRTA